MSHSKYRKFGRSYWLERLGSYEKYVNTCSVCGCRGYRPTIEAEFGDRNYTIFRELKKTLPPLTLDGWGRCSDCAKLQDNK